MKKKNELDLIREEFKNKSSQEIDAFAKKHAIPPKKHVRQYIESGNIKEFIKNMLTFLETWGVKDGTVGVESGNCNAELVLNCYIDKNKEELVEEVVQLEHLSRNLQIRELAELERLKKKYEGKNGHEDT